MRRLLHNKSFGAFVIRFLVVYGLLVVPWPEARRAYAAIFHIGANLLFGSFGDESEVRFAAPSQQTATREVDTEITLTRKTAQGFYQDRLPSTARQLGHMPTAILVALVLATPAPWRRRGNGLLWGLVALHAFIALRVGLLLVEAFSQDNALQMFTLSTFWERVLDRAIPALVRAPAGSYVIPILIWVLVLFRRSDFANQEVSG